MPIRMEQSIKKPSRKYNLKRTLKLGGKPGYILLGYYIVQIVFARGKTDMAAVDGAAVIFAVYALFSGLYAWRNLHKDSASKRFFTLLFTKSPIRWFVLYTCVCFISALWSPIFALSAYRAVECMGMMLIIAATIKNLVVNCTERQIMQWSVTYAFLVIGITFVNGVRSGIGIALYNCQFPATIFFYLAFYSSPTKYIKYPIMCIAFMCKSVTGYVGMALGMVSLMFGKAKYRILGVMIGVTLIGTFYFVGVDKVLNDTIFASKGGVLVDGTIDDNKTSGRSKVWETTIDYMSEQGRQLYGFGFVAGETIIARRIIGQMVIGMHNGFLSAYVGTGIIGLFFFSMFMLTTLILVLKNQISKDYIPPLIACMCAVLLHTYGNPGLGFRVFGTWMPAMFIIILLIGFDIKGKYFK